MKKLLTILFLTTTLISCNGKKNPTIDLKDINSDLKTRADKITSDFFTLGQTDDGLQEFRKKDYITPIANRLLIEPRGPYSWTPWIIGNHLGKIYSYDLFQVIDHGVVKTMSYKINCELRPDELVEFRFDLNEQYKLSKMYLYLYDSKTDEVKNAFYLNYKEL